MSRFHRTAAGVLVTASLSAFLSASFPLAIRAETEAKPNPSALAAGLDPGSAQILKALEELESQRDAKCHSSASRFEDFVFGTPLSSAARLAQIDLQKRLATRIWAQASRDAAAASEETVSQERIRSHAEALLLREEGNDGQVRFTFPGQPTVVIPKIRERQYRTIPYSLRAILAAQQDQILSAGDSLLALSPGAIETLRLTVDSVTLSALMLADRSARERSEFEITLDGMQNAWASLIPDALEPIPDDLLLASREARMESRAKGLALFDAVVNEKTAAYRAYNHLDEVRTAALFKTNIARFYARAPLPKKKSDREDVVDAFQASLDEFTVSLILEADATAGRAGHRQLRAADASAAVQELIPHAIDEFEDVKLFSRLGRDERVSLEAYDCDSFRDFGLHWPSLARAVRRVPEDTRLPDPFAAEIIAEAVSNYGVLLLRRAGEIALQGTDGVRLRPGVFQLSAASIRDRAKRHHDALIPPETPSPIVSSAGHQEPEGAEKFFTDVTAQSGVDFVHRSSRWLGEFRLKQLKTPPTFSGGGVAAEDVDGDSDMDLLFVGGMGNALFLNDGQGHFEDVTRQAGLSVKRPDGSYGEARNPIIADFDNDGLQDILITYVADPQRIFRNLGGNHFEDVSLQSGLGGEGLVAGPVTVFDFDGDGLLDIYITFFGDYLHGAVPKFDRDNRDALPNKLFHNLGGMRFQDVTKDSGTADTGWAMNVGISDLNQDGHPDIYISNLATLVKDNKYVFPDVNTPLDLDLRAMAGMLIKESDVLYMSRVEGDRLTAYAPSESVERGSTSTGWAWDAEFFDFDHDGDDDLYLVNGTNDYNAFFKIHEYEDRNGELSQLVLSHSRESNVFFLNEDGRLKNVSAQSGADFVGNSRSTAYLDSDGDGDLDIAVNNFHAPATILRNNSEKRGLHWLKLRLIGDPARGSNRDAIGARILLTAEGGVRVTREIQGGAGYMSMNPKQQHFGLARAESADVRIVWPNGEEQLLQGLLADHIYEVRQGREDLAGIRRSEGDGVYR